MQYSILFDESTELYRWIEFDKNQFTAEIDIKTTHNKQSHQINDSVLVSYE